MLAKKDAKESREWQNNDQNIDVPVSPSCSNTISIINQMKEWGKSLHDKSEQVNKSILNHHHILQVLKQLQADMAANHKNPTETRQVLHREKELVREIEFVNKVKKNNEDILRNRIQYLQEKVWGKDHCNRETIYVNWQIQCGVIKIKLDQKEEQCKQLTKKLDAITKEYKVYRDKAQKDQLKFRVKEQTLKEHINLLMENDQNFIHQIQLKESMYLDALDKLNSQKPMQTIAIQCQSLIKFQQNGTQTIKPILVSQSTQSQGDFYKKKQTFENDSQTQNIQKVSIKCGLDYQPIFLHQSSQTHKISVSMIQCQIQQEKQERVIPSTQYTQTDALETRNFLCQVKPQTLEKGTNQKKIYIESTSIQTVWEMVQCSTQFQKKKYQIGSDLYSACIYPTLANEKQLNKIHRDCFKEINILEESNSCLRKQLMKFHDYIEQNEKQFRLEKNRLLKKITELEKEKNQKYYEDRSFSIKDRIKTSPNKHRLSLGSRSKYSKEDQTHNQQLCISSQPFDFQGKHKNRATQSDRKNMD